MLCDEVAAEARKPPADQRIGAVFVKLADYAKMYTQYCAAQLQVLATLTRTAGTQCAFQHDGFDGVLAAVARMRFLSREGGGLLPAHTMMNRFFGAKKEPGPPPPTLDEAQKSVRALSLPIALRL